MPPKEKKGNSSGSKTQIPTLDEIHAADSKLSSSTSPSESDFQVILNGINGEPNVRSLSAQLISRYVEKFPHLNQKAFSSLLKLSSDEDIRVRGEALRRIPDFFSEKSHEVTNILCQSLGDEDSSIQSRSLDSLTRTFQNGDDEYRQFFISCLKDQSPASQEKMIQIIKDHFVFSSNNVPLLISICKTTMNTAVLPTISLIRSKSTLLTDQQKAELAAPVLEHLRSELNSGDFKDVCFRLLVPIAENTRSFDETCAEKVMTIISDLVAPRFSEIMDNLDDEQNMFVLKHILERSFELAKFVNSDSILVNIYNSIFLTFPKSVNGKELNFSLIERTLFALAALAKRNSNSFSKLIGKPMIYSGQPNEAEGIMEDENLFKEFEDRLMFIREQSKVFTRQLGSQKDANRSDSSLNSKTTAELNQKISKKIQIIKNVKEITYILLGRNGLTERLPENPSWLKRNHSIFTKFRKIEQRRYGGRPNVHRTYNRGHSYERKYERRSFKTRHYNDDHSNHRPHRDFGHRI